MKLALLILEDERPVREALKRDLAAFARHLRIEEAEDVPTALEVIEEIDAAGDRLALVLADHRLPGTSGVDFLIDLAVDDRAFATRKVLVTGQADQDDTIRAINEAGLDRYVAKPWTADALRELVRDQLTEFVLAAGVDPLPHLAVLDAERALSIVGERGDL
ncbi:response regulator [Thiocapsa marina]|uniref:Response regulator receiver n=1 Tax=Thiocapsa marina 5811 TaxID=768671 RepID=F9UCL0_9GAMM|nr:response regulator [Thiocapsa marina]EGV18123.1 response regulator receiver [Thiocapsa marina 5811]